MQQYIPSHKVVRSVREKPRKTDDQRIGTVEGLFNAIMSEGKDLQRLCYLGRSLWRRGLNIKAEQDRIRQEEIDNKTRYDESLRKSATIKIKARKKIKRASKRGKLNTKRVAVVCCEKPRKTKFCPNCGKELRTCVA